MEQFRQIGEVLGSLKALTALQDDTQINHRQCRLLYDIFTLAFDTIVEEIKQSLKLEEKKTKWKALEQPLEELHRVFKEGEVYIRHCMQHKDWWGKVISLHQNKDCVEFHLHNLFCYFPAVIEAIENAGEVSGADPNEMQKKRVLLSMKYDNEWNDPKLFSWRFGKQYLVTREICSQLDRAWREDRWVLAEALKEKGTLGSEGSKNEQRLGEFLSKKLNGPEPFKFFPSSILVGANDYQVRRRLGGRSEYKEIQWLGESFMLRHILGENYMIYSEISTLLSLSHPNILQYLCGFHDEEKKEYFLVMELMNKDLSSYMKEICSPRRQISYTIPVLVDIMLQIARGMQYLHSEKIYHGNLNPSNVFLKSRNSTEGYFQVKISGFGLSSVKNSCPRNSSNQNETEPLIWSAPEVLAEHEKPGRISTCKYTEKADVYSFGMLCFEILTGKVPFEDRHLQGEKTSRNLIAGERPLFPFHSPKFLVNLIRKCWQTDPSQRPSFTSICRILRYVKKFLAIRPENYQPELEFPPVDYCDFEAMFLKKVSGDGLSGFASVSQIPFEMFAYKLAEMGKFSISNKEKSLDLASDTISICKDDNLSNCRADCISLVEFPHVTESDTRSICSEAPVRQKMMVRPKRIPDANVRKVNISIWTPKGPSSKRQTPKSSTPGTPKRQTPKSSIPGTSKTQTLRLSRSSSSLRNMKTNLENPLPSLMSPQTQSRRKTSGHIKNSWI